MRGMGQPQERQLFKLLANLEEIASIRKGQQILIEDLLTDEGFQILPPSPKAVAVVLRYPIQIKNKERILEMAKGQRVN